MALDATLGPTKFDLKKFEVKLQAVFARCYPGHITLKQLPMIPTEMAQLICCYLTKIASKSSGRWSASKLNRNLQRRDSGEGCFRSEFTRFWMLKILR